MGGCPPPKKPVVAMFCPEFLATICGFVDSFWTDLVQKRKHLCWGVLLGIDPKDSLNIDISDNFCSATLDFVQLGCTPPVWCCFCMGPHRAHTTATFARWGAPPGKPCSTDVVGPVLSYADRAVCDNFSIAMVHFFEYTPPEPICVLFSFL